jgi:glycosyltransferase involved in cell wall biosynthesis
MPSGSNMRIAQIATLSTPVREEGAGSVEAVVWLLARELTRLGHEVTVFAAAGSEVSGELVSTLPGVYGCRGAPGEWWVCEWLNLAAAVEQSRRFDVMHSHAYLYGLALESLSRAPMVHTYHLDPSEDTARLWARAPDACVTAVSECQWSAYPALRPAGVIHHGVDPEQFTLQVEPEDYLCYLGRFTPGKGAVQAVEAARRLGIRLLLAGPESPYFHERVRPLVDGRQVEYIGPVSGADRDRLLGGARALLYPVQWPEPFGLVQVEAMMCGTPVAAMAIGAVPEIIDMGVTGFYTGCSEEFSEQVRRCFTLDRCLVRAHAERRFSAACMAREYAQFYERVAAGTADPARDALRCASSRRR